MVLLVVSLLLIMPSPSLIGEPVASAPMPDNYAKLEVGVYFYSWAGYNETSHEWTGGRGTSHWQISDGIVDKPPIGYYSSMDNSTLSWQLSEMEQFGISFVVVSWWGRNNYVDSAAVNLLRFVHAHNSPIRIAFMVEPYGVVDYIGDMNYIASLYRQYAGHIFEIGSKPVLAFYAPLLPPDDSRFAIRTLGHGPFVEWNYWQGMDGLDDYGGTWSMGQVSEYIGNPKVATDGVVAIIPRYDDYALYLAGSRAHYMRFGLDGTLWEKELGFAKANAKIVIITSWNEYSERTFIEGRTDLALALRTMLG